MRELHRFRTAPHARFLQPTVDGGLNAISLPFQHAPGEPGPRERLSPFASLSYTPSTTACTRIPP